VAPLPHGAMGKHRFAGDVADGVDPLIVGTTTIVNGDDAPLIGSHASGLEAQSMGLGATTHRDQHAVEQHGLVAESRLDATARLAQPGDLRLKLDLPPAPLPPST